MSVTCRCLPFLQNPENKRKGPVSDIPFVVFKGTSEMKSVEQLPELMDYRARPGGFDCLGWHEAAHEPYLITFLVLALS